MLRIHVWHFDRQPRTLPFVCSLKDRRLRRLIRQEEAQFVLANLKEHKPVRFPQNRGAEVRAIEIPRLAQFVGDKPSPELHVAPPSWWMIEGR